jgi:hypothetical protein
MTTYTQMMFNADTRNNPVNVIWEQIYYDDNDYKIKIDQYGDERFETYDEASAWVQEYIEECEYNIKYMWKIVDDVTNKNIESNLWDVEEEHEDITGEFYEEDEELVAEYEELLEEKRIEEVIRNIAISKICRNTIYNLGLGLKLSMKNCGLELIV